MRLQDASENDTKLRLTHTRREEIANSVSHGLGTALSVVGLILMILRTLPLRGNSRLTSVIVFGSTMILAHLSSTLYHSFSGKKMKRIMQLVDHGSIYLL